MSPIPNFDHNHVLPPHLGNPINAGDLSPYPCSIFELCHKFATSTKRIEILKGLISFRQKMTEVGITEGFQWLDGSFLENIEVSEKRDPNDLDIVTFFGGIDNEGLIEIDANFPEFSSSLLSKTKFHMDHYPVDITFSPLFTVEYTRYWLQLFTHNRRGVWKGMLRLSLDTGKEDQMALDFLNGLNI